jgi:hypothetical protein
VREQLIQAIETLRNLAYLTQNLQEEELKYFQNLKKKAQLTPENDLPKALQDVQSEIERGKKLVGCKLSNDEINRAVEWLTSAGKGYVCLSKRHIERGFDNFAYVFPPWPHMPGHTMVQFDPDVDAKSPRKFFLAEEVLFEDVRLLWNHITRLYSDGLPWKKGDYSHQHELASYMRLAAAAIYHFLEAYLNGIAYNCFQDFHDGMNIDDHDLLAEWDSGTRRVRFTSFERKLKEYPTICCKYLQREADLDAEANISYLLQYPRQNRGKVVRCRVELGCARRQLKHHNGTHLWLTL